MKLLTREVERLFQKTGGQSESKDPTVVCKFFNPTGAGTWWMTEMFYVVQNANGETEDIPAHRYAEIGDRKIVDHLFYGYASIFGDHNDEWGYTALSELQAFRGLAGLGIERDLHFGNPPMSKACPKAVARGEESESAEQPSKEELEAIAAFEE